MIKFVVKGQLPSLNEYITQCRNNKYGANKWKHKYQELICKQITEQVENFGSGATVKTIQNVNSKGGNININF